MDSKKEQRKRWALSNSTGAAVYEATQIKKKTEKRICLKCSKTYYYAKMNNYYLCESCRLSNLSGEEDAGW